MKKLFLVFCSTLIIPACFSPSAMQDKMRQDMAAEYMSGKHDPKLIDTVAFDTDCSKDQIKIVDRSEEAGSGRYKIEACGKNLKYKRTGTIFHAADKKPY